jgi:uncharacterized protein DUF4129
MISGTRPESSDLRARGVRASWFNREVTPDGRGVEIHNGDTLDMVGQWARRLWPLVIVGGLLAGIAVLSTVGTPGIYQLTPHLPRRSPKPLPSASLRPSPGSPVRPQSGTSTSTPLAGWLIDIAKYGCVLLVGVVVLALLWLVIKSLLSRGSSRRAATFGVAGTMNRRDAVLAAVDDSIAELARDDGEAREAVIACWVRLEAVAAAAGSEQQVHHTSSDLVSRLLGDHQVSASVLLALADLYRTARYSTQYIDSSMREQARAALGRLRDELSRSRSGPLADEPVAFGSDGVTADDMHGERHPRPSATRESRR